MGMEDAEHSTSKKEKRSKEKNKDDNSLVNVDAVVGMSVLDNFEESEKNDKKKKEKGKREKKNKGSSLQDGDVIGGKGNTGGKQEKKRKLDGQKDNIEQESGLECVKSKEEKKRKKKNRIELEKEEGRGHGVREASSVDLHMGEEMETKSLGLSKDEKDSGCDIEVEVRKAKKKKQKKRYIETELQSTEEEDVNVDAEVEEGHTLNGENEETKKKKKKKKKKDKMVGSVEYKKKSSDIVSNEQTNQKNHFEGCSNTDLGYSKKRKKEKKSSKSIKDCSKEILEKHVDTGNMLDDNGVSLNEGCSGSINKKKRDREKESASGSGNLEQKRKAKRVKFSNKVEVFPSSDSRDVGNENHKGRMVHGKRFTKEEDKILEAAVLKYIKDHDLGEDGLQKVLHCRSHPELRKTCWEEISASLPWRPKAGVNKRAHLLFERDDTRKWTPEELEFVRKYYETHGPKWKELAQILNKSRIHVKDAWRRICLPNKNKGRWSQDEYQNLFNLVNMDLRMKVFEEKKSKHGMLRDNIAWEAISHKLSTRNFVDCCLKWYQQLETPLVKEGQWSSSDDIRLLNELLCRDYSSVEEVDWDNLLDHRTGELCRKRWFQMVQHLGHHGLKEFAEQVDVLSRRYCQDVLEARLDYENKTPVDVIDSSEPGESSHS